MLTIPPTDWLGVAAKTVVCPGNKLVNGVALKPIVGKERTTSSAASELAGVGQAGVNN